jgi:hypothetical protein
MRFRSGSFFVGLVLAAGAFVALFVFGQIFNPPPYNVVVVVKEVAPGETLAPDMLGFDAQSLDPRVAGEYVLKGELDGWLGAVVVDPLHPGEPLMHAHLVRAENPAAVRRLALGLEDGSLAAMVIPVDPEIAPQDIRPGDRVDVLYGVGNVETSGLAQGAALFPQEVAPPAGAAPAPGTAGEEETGEAGEGLAAPTGGTPPAPAATPEMTFPMAKACVRGLRVLDVIREEQPNPAYGGPDSGEPATIPGEVLAIQVALPREQEEMLHYVVTTGEYRVALLSPNAPLENDPTLGMTWDDLKAYFWAEREQSLDALGEITGTRGLIGPGAAAIVATAQATPAAIPVLAGTPTTQPAPGEAEEPGLSEAEGTPASSPTPGEVALTPTPQAGAEAPSPTPALAEGPAQGTGGGGPGLNSSSLLTGLICAGVGLALLAAAVLVVRGILRRRAAAQSRTGN